MRLSKSITVSNKCRNEFIIMSVSVNLNVSLSLNVNRYANISVYEFIDEFE